MFVGAAMVALCLAGVATADEASAVTLIEKVGGKITREGKLVIGVDVHGTDDVTDASLKVLKDLKQLRTLILRGTPVTDAGLKELKGLKELTKLDLKSTGVTDVGVADLQKALPGCKITR